MGRIRERSGFGFLAALLTLSSAGAWGQTNPVPLINDPLVPGSAVPGGKSFTLKVNGTGFASGASVLWDGTALVTVVNSQSKLTATVPAANIAKGGTAYVSVTNPKASQASNAVAFPITYPSTSVAFAGSNAAALTSPLVLGVADFNGDGNLDIALQESYSGNIDVLLGHGDGTFSAPVVTIVNSGTYSYGATVGDFNGDGKLDIATSYVGIYLGNGDGTFTVGAQYPGSSYGGGIAAGDFNGDGKLDLAAIGCNDEAGCSGYVLLGQGDGTFQFTAYFTGGTVTAPAVGDFNRDGKLDVAAMDERTYLLGVFLGNGDGTLQNVVDYSEYAYGVVTADFNGDGILDLVATDGGGDLYVFLGKGDGTFGTGTLYSSGTSNLLVGDFNEDGHPDLITATSICSPSCTNAVSLLLGNGDGTFQNQVEYSLGGFSGAFQAAGDFNGDGRLDFVTAGSGQNAVSVFLQTAAQLSTTSLNFGDQSINTTSPPQTVTITNIGSSSISISGVSITGTDSSDFAQTNICGTSLAAGASCAINVTFTPNTTGSLSATLTIADSAVGSPQTVSLTGTGTQPTVQLSATSITFGMILVNSSSPAKPVTLTNTGNGTLSITNISTTGDFSQTNNCGSSVGAGTGCAITVTFKPTAAGTRTGALSITDNALGSPQTVSLSGTGTVVKLSAASINFGSQKLGTTSAPISVSIGNLGTTPLNIASIGIRGADHRDFAETSNCGQSLAAGKTCGITVTFTPTATGARSAWVAITDNGGGSPQTIALSGTGT